MRAVEVLPHPRGPENKYACAIRPVFIEFLSVSATNSCPARSSKHCGRRLVAVTSYAISYHPKESCAIIRQNAPRNKNMQKFIAVCVRFAFVDFYKARTSLSVRRFQLFFLIIPADIANAKVIAMSGSVYPIGKAVFIRIL